MKNGKSVIKNVDGLLQLSIPSKKNWFVLSFSIFWLTGWGYGFYSIGNLLLYRFDHGQIDYFLMVWLLAWFLGGTSVISFVGWGLFGKEKLKITKDTMKFQKTMLGIGKRRTIPKSEIKNLRLHMTCDNFFSACKLVPFGLNTSRISFDHGMRTYAFGLSLDEAELTQLMTLIESKLSVTETLREEEQIGIQYSRLFQWNTV